MAARDLQLRDLLACHCVAGLLAYYASSEGISNREVAVRAYQIADQMLDARDIEPGDLENEFRRAHRDG